MASKQTLIDAYLSGLDSNVKADIDVSSGKRLITDTPTLATKSTVVDADVGSILKAKKAAEEKAAKAAAAAAAKAQKAAQKAAEKAAKAAAKEAKAAEKAAAAQAEEDAIAAAQSGKKTGTTADKTATGTKTTTKTAAKNGSGVVNPWNVSNSNGVTTVLAGIEATKAASGKTTVAPAKNNSSDEKTDVSSTAKKIKNAKSKKKTAAKAETKIRQDNEYEEEAERVRQQNFGDREMLIDLPEENEEDKIDKAFYPAAVAAAAKTQADADNEIKQGSAYIRTQTTKAQAEADYKAAKKAYSKDKTDANKEAMENAHEVVLAFEPEQDANVTLQGTALTGNYDADTVENGKNADGNPLRGVTKDATGKSYDNLNVFRNDTRGMRENLSNDYVAETLNIESQFAALSETEKDYINYLYGEYDRKTAAKLTQTYLNNKQNSATVELAKGTKNIFTDTANAIGSIGNQIKSTPTYLAEVGANTVENIVKGENDAVPLYSTGSQGMARSAAEREAFVNTTDNMKGQFLRSTGLSIAQNLANRAMFGGAGKVLSLASMSAQAAASGAYQAAAEGKTGAQQVLKAIQSGATEYLTENISWTGLESVFNSAAKSIGKTAAQKGIANLVMDIGKQAATEFGEEVVSEATGIVFDYISDVLGGTLSTNEWANMYREELADNPQSAAAMNVAGKIIGQILKAGAAGALSGGIMGGGAIGLARVQNANAEYAARNAANAAAYKEAAQRYANAENGVYGQNGAFYDGSADAENMSGRNNQFLAYVKRVGKDRAEAAAPVVESAPVTENVQTADETTTDRPRKISEIPYEEIVQHYHEGTMTDNDIKALRGNNEYRLRFMEDTNVTLPSTFSKTKEFLQNKNVKTSSSEYDELNTLIEKANAGTLTIQERKRILQMKGLWESTTGVKIPDTNNQVVKFFDKPVAVSARISDNSSAQRIAYDLRSQTRYDAEKVKSVFARHGISISDGAAKSISITLQNTENNAALVSEVEKAVYSGEMRKKATANRKTVQAVKPAEAAKTVKPVTQTAQQTTAQPTLAAVQNTQEAATQNSTENQGQLLDLQSPENYNTGKEVITDATEAENERSETDKAVYGLPENGVDVRTGVETGNQPGGDGLEDVRESIQPSTETAEERERITSSFKDIASGKEDAYSAFGEVAGARAARAFANGEITEDEYVQYFDNIVAEYEQEYYNSSYGKAARVAGTNTRTASYRQAYNLFENSSNMTDEEIDSAATEIARRIVGNPSVDTATKSEMREALNEMRRTRLFVGEKEAGDLKYAYGSITAANRALGMRFTQNMDGALPWDIALMQLRENPITSGYIHGDSLDDLIESVSYLKETLSDNDNFKNTGEVESYVSDLRDTIVEMVRGETETQQNREDLSAKKNPFKVKEVKTQSNTVDALLDNSGKTYEDMIPADKLNGVNGVLNGITEDSANGLYRYGVSQLAVDEVKKAIRSGASAEDIKAIVYEDLAKGTHTVYTDKQALQEARDAVETPGGVDATYNNIREKTESNQTLNATEFVEGIALYDALSQELKAADDGSKEAVAEKMRYVARALAKSASETGLALQKTQLASADPVIAVEKIATEIENVFAEENKGSDVAAKKAADVLYEEWVNVSDATQKTAEIKDIMRAVRKIARENGASLTQKGVRNVAKLVAKGATAADIYTTIVNDMTGYSPLSAEEIGDINERMREAQQKADIYGAQSKQVNDVLDYVYNKVIAEHFAGRQSGLSALAYANMLSAPTTMNRNLFGNIVNGMATESNYRLSRLFDAAFDKVMKRKGADYDRTTGKRASRQMVGEAYNYIDHVAGLLEDNNSQKPKDRINRALGQKMKPSKTVIGDLAKKMVKGYSDLVSTPLDATDKKGLIGLLNVVDAIGDNGVAKSLQSAVENIQQTDAKVKGYGYIGLAGLYNNFARYASNYLAAHGYGEGAFAEYETERRKVNLSNRLLGDSSISEQLRAVGDMRGADSYDDVIRANVREYYNMDNATLNEAIRVADSDSILSLFKDSSDFRDFVKEAYQNKRYKPNAIYTDGNKAIAFGVDMAKKATFHTDSLVARQMNKMKNIKGPVGFLFSGILPFVKTPVNVTATAYRNSWIGLLQSTVEMISHAKNGALTYTDAQNMAAGVRGGLMNTALGLLLSLTGVLSGKDRDDKEGKYKKAIFGEQGYTLNLFGQKYSIDWLLQSDPGLLVGATLGDKIKDGTEVDDLESGFNNAFDFVASAVDPVFGGTMLSGISDTIGRSANSQSGNILLEMMFQNLFTKGKQLLTPAYMGKIASGIAGTRKSTYSEYSGAFKSVDQFITYVKSRWPFTVNDVNDYIDCWGNKQSTYGMIYQMYSPGYYGNNISTKTDEELMRLYGVTNDTSVIPGTASTQAHNEIVGTDLNGNDIKESRKLTKDEYQKFAEERGQAAYRMITDLQESSEYKYLTDTEKAELTSSLFDVASDIGYRKANKNFAINNDAAYSIYEEYGEEGVVTYLIAKKNIENQYNSAKKNGVERKQVMLDYVSGMNDSDKIMIASQYNDGVGFISENYGDTAALEYLDMLSYADADGNGAINRQEALVYLKHNNVSEPGLLWWKATGNAKAGQAYKTSGLAGVNALYNEKVGK